MPAKSATPFIVDKQGRPIQKAVAQKFEEAFYRIKAGAVALLVWDRLFDDDDRKRLGGDLDKCYESLGTARMWAQAKGVPMEQAVIDVARGVDLMSDQTANWLLRELGLEDAKATVSDDKPSWDAAQGELVFCGDPIRKLRVMKQPSNIQRILDAFQAAGWPTCIDNPLTFGQQQLYQALRSLNKDLKIIRFRAQKGGGAIIWEHC